ncbi:MAG: peptidoglycan DD-metalloendopeptidase family protein [Clostridia bacterium]|nr:peptidoglycan DD-metalloendopeptidase family protein [Clostridia bacterium]
MNNISEKNLEQLNNDVTAAKDEIAALVEQSKVKIQEKDLNTELDRLLAEETKRLHEERKAHYAEKGERKRSSQLKKEKAEAASGPEPGVKIAERRSMRKDKAAKVAYAARIAKLEMSEKPKVSEGAVRRTFRLLMGLMAVYRQMHGKSWYTSEKRRAAIKGVFDDCWAPVMNGAREMVATAWDFLQRAYNDLKKLLAAIGGGLAIAGYSIWSIFKWLWNGLWDIRYKLEAHKHLVFTVASVAIVSMAAVALVYSSSIGYEYSYHGKQLGVAKKKEDIYETLEVLGDKLAAAAGTNVTIDVEQDIEFNQIIVGLGADCDSKDDILNILTYMKDLEVQAYAISVNGVQQVVLESEALAKDVLDDIRESYALARSGVEYTEITYAEDTEIDEVSVLLGEVWNQETAAHYLKTGTTRTLVGEGDEPILNVKTTELSTYTEAVEYGTQYIDNASLYVGETELKTPGSNGVRQLVAEVERVNGEEIGREIISSNVITEPVDQVIYRGTKVIPKRGGTGSFAYPIKTYTITSRFGMRWGRLHTGVDFAAATGTKIYAADGGTVTFAGYKNSYGYIVIISHGGLYETYYAHCSQLLVSAGDEVFQGQNIALVGSTGHSTGPHLHFEIRYNGEPGDPLGYL